MATLQLPNREMRPVVLIDVAGPSAARNEVAKVNRRQSVCVCVYAVDPGDSITVALLRKWRCSQLEKELQVIIEFW